MLSNQSSEPSSRSFRRAAFPFVCAIAGFAAISAFAQAFAPGEIRVSSSPYSPPQSTLRVNTKEVQVEVVVRDPRGMPVGGLTEDQFQLLDKSQLRKLTGFVPEITNSARPISAYSKPKASVDMSSDSAAPSNSNPRSRFVALFFDDIHILPGDFRHAQIAAERFVREAMSPADKVAIFTASSSTTLDFSADKSKLEETIDALRARPMVNDGSAGDCPRISPYQAKQIIDGDLMAFESAYLEYLRCHPNDYDSTPDVMNPTELNDPNYIRLHPEVTQVREHAIELWEHTKEVSVLTVSAIRVAINRLAAAPGDRMLLLASSGFISEHLEQAENEITVQAMHSRIVINALDARGLFVEGPGRPPDVTGTEGGLPLATFLWENTTRGEKQQAEQAAMENFTMATGGLLFRNSNDLDYGFYELGVVPAFSYLLTFSAEDVRPDGAFHPIKVKIDRPNTYPEYRPGYYAPTPAAAAAKVQVPTGDKLDQSVASQDNLSEIPALAFARPAKSSSGAQELAVTIHVDIRSLPFERKDDRQLERLDLVVALFDAQNNFVVGKHGTFELALKSESLARLESTGINGTLSITAPPGAYRLRAVAQEALTGKTAATSQPIQIQ